MGCILTGSSTTCTQVVIKAVAKERNQKARREPGITLSMPLATISRKHVCMILSSDSVNAVAKSLHITFPLRRIARLDRQVVDYDPLDDRLGQCGDLCP